MYGRLHMCIANVLYSSYTTSRLFISLSGLFPLSYRKMQRGPTYYIFKAKGQPTYAYVFLQESQVWVRHELFVLGFLY